MPPADGSWLSADDGTNCHFVLLIPYHCTDPILAKREGKDMTVLTIGKAAQQAGVGVETVRFYERQGLIEQPPKPDGSGVRRYSDELVARIRFIREAQQLGFSLREIRELTELRADPAADCANVREQAVAKLQDVRRKIERLQEIGTALETLIAVCPGRGGLQACSIMDALEHRSRRAVDEAAPRFTAITIPRRRTRT
jgi:MerR family mercuric resistance operon transcriptional regulator